MFTPRRLLARLRAAMASQRPKLPQIAQLVAIELVAEVCSIYVMRPGDLLELAATEGLRPEAVGRTRLRVGEGIVGTAAATGKVLNLPDAQSHPAFVLRPETGEDNFASMLALPVRRAGHTLGVLAVQNRAPRRYGEDEVESLETVAMVLGELLMAAGTADGAEQGVAATVPRHFTATALVAGVAMGPVVLHGASRAPRRLLADDVEAELARLAGAVKLMRRQLDALFATSLPPRERDEDSEDEAGEGALVGTREVLEAYRLVAADDGWLRRVQEAVRGGLTAEAAVHRVGGELRDRMRRLADPYLRERAADIEDLASRLLAALDGSGRAVAPAGAILLARRLGPAELLEWHAAGAAAIGLEEGTSNGHAAIVARALGLPLLTGLRGVLDAVEPDDQAVLDADAGQLILRPNQETRDAYARALVTRAARQAQWADLRGRPAQTRDGATLRLMLNVGLTLELDQLAATGADGIGLFRTEIAMLASGRLLDVAEQAAIYGRVMDAAGERPVVFRTLDLGGDKMMPDNPPPSEENPAMGWRSLRIGLDRPAMMRRQLRALLLAAAGRTLTVMFPMVATVAEFRAARALLEAEAARMRPAPERLVIGTMLEVPALLWQLEALLPLVDFVSIGSNDLMQFLFAADRGTPAIAGRYDLLSPPVLDVLDTLAQRGAVHGVPLSVCGEAASFPLEAAVLATLGYHTLSMPALGILPVKAQLADLNCGAFRPVLDTIRRTADGAASLREPITAWAREHGLAT